MNSEDATARVGETARRLTGHANLIVGAHAGPFHRLADIIDGKTVAQAYANSVLEGAIAAGTMQPDTPAPQRAWFAARPLVPALATTWTMLRSHGVDPAAHAHGVTVSGALAQVEGVPYGAADYRQPLQLGPRFLSEWLTPAARAVMPVDLPDAMKDALASQVAKRGLAVFAGRAAMHRNEGLSGAYYEATRLLEDTVGDARPRGGFVIVTEGNRGIIEWKPAASCKQFESTHACPTCPLGEKALAERFDETSEKLVDRLAELPDSLRRKVIAHGGLDPEATGRKMRAAVEANGLPLSTAPPQVKQLAVAELPSVGATTGLRGGELRRAG